MSRKRSHQRSCEPQQPPPANGWKDMWARQSRSTSAKHAFIVPENNREDIPGKGAREGARIHAAESYSFPRELERLMECNQPWCSSPPSIEALIDLELFVRAVPRSRLSAASRQDPHRKRERVYAQACRYRGRDRRHCCDFDICSARHHQRQPVPRQDPIGAGAEARTQGDAGQHEPEDCSVFYSGLRRRHWRRPELPYRTSFRFYPGPCRKRETASTTPARGEDQLSRTGEAANRISEGPAGSMEFFHHW